MPARRHPPPARPASFIRLASKVARSRKPEARDIAAEIIRRVGEANAATGGGYVVRLSNPPTAQERLQLLAASLEGRKVAIMPHKCETTTEWVTQHDRTHAPVA